ncbi:uracil-5--methyltransferase TRM9 [Lepidopterella palustris CBS 459.81]|uniref:Uracil-5--methyltransferase TRM9 n=1 Tax=Lepidopterella palustris CBS 459.81 TaxID=1314670 RepID=A0A8E2EJQ4_9PEZI|nr:uracil-5--methyltransferase TRM9 [Lepidopterella palustris CBS 459.81]
MTDLSERADAYEAEHVHAVYEQIASHFSSTRYKPWPIVEQFLKGIPDGSIGVDVGCGNGKYLAVNPNVFVVGSDRSTNLVKIAAKKQPHAAIVADILNLPHPLACFDFAISIAVVHHLSTPSRRVEAVKAVLDLLTPSLSRIEDGLSLRNRAGGRALMYVWALEQKDSRRGWDEGHEQDVMVPWVMKGNNQTKKDKCHKKNKNRDPKQVAGSVSEPFALNKESSASSQPINGNTENADKHQNTADQQESKTFQRYYHLYRKGELEHDIVEAGGTVIDSGYEKDNWWAIATRNSSD